MEDIMEERLYNMMDWPEIEGVVYADCDHPHHILGPRQVEDEVLIQAFIPHAESVSVKIVSTGKTYPLELADEAGF